MSKHLFTRSAEILREPGFGFQGVFFKMRIDAQRSFVVLKLSKHHDDPARLAHPEFPRSIKRLSFRQHDFDSLERGHYRIQLFNLNVKHHKILTWVYRTRSGVNSWRDG